MTSIFKIYIMSCTQINLILRSFYLQLIIKITIYCFLFREKINIFLVVTKETPKWNTLTDKKKKKSPEAEDTSYRPLHHLWARGLHAISILAHLSLITAQLARVRSFYLYLNPSKKKRGREAYKLSYHCLLIYLVWTLDESLNLILHIAFLQFTVYSLHIVLVFLIPRSFWFPFTHTHSFKTLSLSQFILYTTLSIP